MVEHLIREAKKEKWNVIIEGTLRTSELPIREAEGLHENGYSVELCIVAVKPEKSRLGTLERYEDMIEKGRVPRITPKEHHDLVVEKIPDNLNVIYQEKAFDIIKIYDRENTLLYNSKETPNINPKDILEKEFNRSWKKEEIEEFKQKWNKLIETMEYRKVLKYEINPLKIEKNQTLEKVINQKEVLVEKNPWEEKLKNDKKGWGHGY